MPEPTLIYDYTTPIIRRRSVILYVILDYDFRGQLSSVLLGPLPFETKSSFLSKVRWRVHYRTLMGFSGVSEAGFSGVTELLTRLKGKIPVQFSAKMERDPVSKQFPELDPFHKLG
ncbi:hypothetical protein BHM03_00021862 [Ensete ventricosum]|nr:hypothetical protein BHM03_00021862 [Ensete ventricosum]